MGENAELMLSRVLRDRGQRVTPQRLAIARTVRELDRHTTAETVFGHVSEQMPGVSLPTVYATLDLLEELGLVRRVPTEAGTAVYDPRTEDHHHLVCRTCGEIMDLDAPVARLAMPDIPSPHNPVLLEAAVPSVERIRAKIVELTGF